MPRLRRVTRAEVESSVYGAREIVTAREIVLFLPEIHPAARGPVLIIPRPVFFHRTALIALALRFEEFLFLLLRSFFC
jgi:hypothetical protein